tara:strand:+ start:608 stop:820 length:213 start_codon:yes stop_codon:yes gene_type:complete
MYRWLALLFLAFSIAGVSAEDEIPEVVNETSIDPPSEDDDEPSGISDEVLMMAAAVLGVCIIVAALIIRG